jgi:hypothetical protein
MKGKSIPLKDAITLVVQPRSPGFRAQDETRYLLEKLGWAAAEKNPPER